MSKSLERYNTSVRFRAAMRWKSWNRRIYSILPGGTLGI